MNIVVSAWKFIERLTKVGVSGLLIVSLFTMFDSYIHLAELFSHFRVQAIVLGGVALFVFLVHRKPLWCCVALASLLINSERVYSYLNLNELDNFETDIRSQFNSKNLPQKTLRIMLSNVNSQNTQANRVLQLIEDKNPDIIFLQEVNLRWLADLSKLKKHYPFTITSPRPDNFGIAMYSRIPLTKSEIITSFSSRELPSVYVELQVHGKRISLLSTHPLPPINKLYFNERNEQLSRLADFVKLLPDNKLVIGDLNATMWSYYLQLFSQKSQLINVRKGRGIYPTWPASLPAMQIPIDHAYIDKHMKVRHIEVGADIGSDHLPLIIDIE